MNITYKNIEINIYIFYFILMIISLLLNSSNIIFLILIIIMIDKSIYNLYVIITKCFFLKKIKTVKKEKLKLLKVEIYRK